MSPFTASLIVGQATPSDWLSYVRQRSNVMRVVAKLVAAPVTGVGIGYSALAPACRFESCPHAQ
jgi:hypothetical protein